MNAQSHELELRNFDQTDRAPAMSDHSQDVVKSPAGLPYTREVRRLSGWGRAGGTTAEVLTTPSVELIADAVARVADQNSDKPAHLRRGVIARGLGRSYGDVAQNSGGLVIDMTALRRIHRIDAESALVDLDAGGRSGDADEGGAAVRAVGTGAAGHPAGHHRRGRSPTTSTARTTTARDPSATTSANWTCWSPTAGC